MRDELPEALQSLIAAERAAPIADLAVRSAVRAKLAATVGVAPLGTAVASASATSGLLLGAGKILAIVALAVGAGTMVRGATSRAEPLVTPHVTTISTEPTEPPTDVISTAADEPLVPVSAPRAANEPLVAASAPRAANEPRVAASVPASVKPALRVEPPTPSPTPSLAVAPSAPPPSQSVLLRDAWSALSGGDAARALAITKRDEALHPSGALAEERTVLQIEALARLGRLDEARVVVARFQTNYPHSVHRARIDRAIEEKP